MSRDYSRFEFNDYGPVTVGRVLRDPVTGELREVVSVIGAGDLTSSWHLTGGSSERCALFGGGKDSRARKCATHSPSHQGPRLKETA